MLVFFGDGLLEAEDTDGQRYDETQITGFRDDASLVTKTCAEYAKYDTSSGYYI